MLRDVFSQVHDTADCLVCGNSNEVSHRFCPYCGTLNPLYPQFLPLLSQDERERVSLVCSDQWHQEMLEFDPNWMFCFTCGIRVKQAH